MGKRVATRANVYSARRIKSLWWIATIGGAVAAVVCHMLIARAVSAGAESFIDVSRAYDDANQLFEEARRLLQQEQHRDAIKYYEKYLALTPNVSSHKFAASIHGLAKAHLALNDLASAQMWTDRFYANTAGAKPNDSNHTEPAYQLCRALRMRGEYARAYHYCLVATSKAEQFDKTQPAAFNPYIDGVIETNVSDHLLDYEKSILWYYVEDMSDRRSRLHILGVCMHLLENPILPPDLLDSVSSNLQYYASSLRGLSSALKSEQAESEWRYSTPLFMDEELTLIRAVNYNISKDGRYHTMPPGKQVDTKIVLVGDTDTAFMVRMENQFKARAAAQNLHHRDVSVLGLEDSRIIRGSRDGVLYTLSTSREYSKSGRTFDQVLGILDLRSMTHSVLNLIQGPYDDLRDEKNWVFAGSLDNVVYDWHPFVRIGAIDVGSAALDIHTELPSPSSFEGMRGSSNGVLYQDEWWFVTHTAIYRPGKMRKYIHRFVVLDKALTQIVRHSLPFTFTAGNNSDVEYCIAFAANSAGLSFGYSVRDRSSWVHRASWLEVDEMFENSVA